MKIINKKIDDLVPADYNPRKIGVREKMELTKSLKKFDFVQPIVVNINKKRFNVIIGGHQKVKIAKELGYKTVPCVEVDLSIDQERELNLRLNKNGGEFDPTLLTLLDKDLLRQVGFLDKELNKVFADNAEIDQEEEFTTEILEENNYLVFTFDNSIDWLAIEDFFKLKSVNAKDSATDYKRKGIGRVLNGGQLLDDDIKQFGYYENLALYLMTEQEVYNLFENNFRMTEDAKTKLWGVNLQSDKKFYREYSPLSLSSVILGPCMGIIKDKDIRFDERLGLKEDYDYSIQVLRKFRKVLRFNKYHYASAHISKKG